MQRPELTLVTICFLQVFRLRFRLLQFRASGPLAALHSFSKTAPDTTSSSWPTTPTLSCRLLASDPNLPRSLPRCCLRLRSLCECRARQGADSSGQTTVWSVAGNISGSHLPRRRPQSTKASERGLLGADEASICANHSSCFPGCIERLGFATKI